MAISSREGCRECKEFRPMQMPSFRSTWHFSCRLSAEVGDIDKPVENSFRSLSIVYGSSTSSEKTLGDIGVVGLF